MNDIAIQQNPASLLALAIEKGSQVEALEKIMDLQERWDINQSRKAFYAARVKFQSLCPVIKKNSTVEYGKTKWNYADLSDIAEQIKPSLSECDLTYRWETEDSGATIRVTCILSHMDGHSESNTMGAGEDDSGQKNLIQQRGSTMTYLQRYTLIGVLGITSADNDDDGRSSGAPSVERCLEHMVWVRKLWRSVAAIKKGISTGQLDVAVEATIELTKEEQFGLNLAPTKGGVFTTEEIKIMKSDEWGKVRRSHMENNNV